MDESNTSYAGNMIEEEMKVIQSATLAIMSMHQLIRSTQRLSIRTQHQAALLLDSTKELAAQRYNAYLLAADLRERRMKVRRVSYRVEALSNKVKIFDPNSIVTIRKNKQR